MNLTGYRQVVLRPHTETELANDTADVGSCLQDTLEVIGETLPPVQSVLQHGGNRLAIQEISIRIKMGRRTDGH